jgi:hypothetical protein
MALTNAEKQRRYRERKAARGWQLPGVVRPPAPPPKPTDLERAREALDAILVVLEAHPAALRELVSGLDKRRRR